MQNSSCFFLGILLLLLIMTVCQPSCKSNTQLPKFYICTNSVNEAQIKMNMMIEVPSLTNQSTNSLIYPLNYPVELLINSSSTNISSLICIQKLDVLNTGNSILYRLSQQKSTISLLLTLTYTEFKWNDFMFNVLMFSQPMYPNIVVGELSKTGKQYGIIGNNGTFSTSVSASLPLTFTSTDASTLVFINGITMSQQGSNNFEYEVQLTESINMTSKKYNVTINSGQNTNLSSIYLNYIIFSQSSNNYEISGSYATFTQITSTMTQYMGNTVSSTNYFLVGLNSLKMKRGPTSLYFQFKIKDDGQNQLLVIVPQPVNILKIATFRIGNIPQNLCKNCSTKNIVQNYGNTTSCVSSCDIGTVINTTNSGLKKCLLCPTELSLVPNNQGGCSCQSGYTIKNGICQTQTTSSILNTDFLPTFSTYDCPDPNSYINSLGQCICLQGYTQNVVNGTSKCVSICPNGYFNGQMCISCPSGSYGWNQQQTCYQCTNYCFNCLTQFTCQQCLTGFEIIHPQNSCKQICGDGVNITTPCDDGNNISGDGCSSDCQIQDGYICQTQVGGTKSICTKQTLNITRKNIQFSSGCLKITYLVLPAPTHHYTSEELSNIVSLDFQKSSPYQTYILHNPDDLSELRIISTFGVMPSTPITVTVAINFPNYNNGVFKDSATFNPTPTATTFARKISTTVDILH